MQYFFMRVSAILRKRPALFEDAGVYGDQSETRADYFRKIFSRRIDFFHRKSKFVFIAVGVDDDVIVGRLGRPHTETVNAPPDEGFEEKILHSWRASNFLFRISDDPDGQVISMQYRTEVGYPPAILESLIAHVNEGNPDSKWVLEISAMSNEQSFWNAVEDYGKQITAVHFSFITPNILGLRSVLNEGLKDARDKNHARRVDISLRNDDGDLDLTAQNIREGVEYVAKGGGTAKLRVNKKVVYDSDQTKKTIKPEEDEPLTDDNRSFWKKLAAQIFT